MRIVFIGPPGAGKGTQCARLARRFSIPHLSTGEILRTARERDTPLGKIVGPIMDSGGLVHDELMLDVVAERLADQDCAIGYILDGFPRTVPQARSFAEWLEAAGQQLDHVIQLVVDERELRDRLTARYNNLPNPRADDRPESIMQRLDIYRQQTEPLLEFYRHCDGILRVVDGIGTIDEVFARILDAVGCRN
jgi:adenylate kinase